MPFQDSINVEGIDSLMVQHLHTTSASISIFHLVDTNTVILTEDGSVLLAHERDHLPDFLLKLQQENFKLLSLHTKQDSKQCYMFTNSLGLTYLSTLVEFEMETSNTWVIGPFLMQMPDINTINALFHTEQSKRTVMLDFVRSLKLISNSKVQSIVNILHHAGSILQAPYRILNSPQETLDPLNAKDMQHILQQPDEHSTKKIELIYELEKDIVHAIENGDKIKIKEAMSEVKHLHDFSERFPNQPVRALKNMLVVLNTIFRIAAERGKVHPFFLHHISEKFSKQIERSDTINSLNLLLDVMPEEYCDLVKNCAVSGYSPLVQRAIQQIKINFSKPLDLQQLSEECHVHPSHLSRQFKKETGMTLTDYQNRMRVDEAKILLKKDLRSIDMVAGYVGYEDAGYFTRIFKKLEGITPSTYRKVT
ncbi:helix-turn-helix transcriptional regulator [Paenibacillus sp. FA6]|uniref:helix-turn-helix transcriptional regulator n=1 Tax=Paenibacillus sp. FA6 TaxID=3413029 RepID=UPI003F65ADF5